MWARLRPTAQVGCTFLRRYSSAPQFAPVADSWRNPAAVLYGANDLRFQDHPLPDHIPDDFVRVRMRSVGICGSDVHFFKQVRGPMELLRRRLNAPHPYILCPGAHGSLLGDGTDRGRPRMRRVCTICAKLTPAFVSFNESVVFHLRTPACQGGG